MKNLQRAFRGLSKQMMGVVVTVIKLDMREYEESGLKVGDKVYLEITRIEKSSICPEKLWFTNPYAWRGLKATPKFQEESMS